MGGWGGVGRGWGARTVLARHFHLLAHCIHVLVNMGGWGGVGWGHGLDVLLLSTSAYLLTAFMSWSAWTGWGWGGVRCGAIMYLRTGWGGGGWGGGEVQ